MVSDPRRALAPLKCAISRAQHRQPHGARDLARYGGERPATTSNTTPARAALPDPRYQSITAYVPARLPQGIEMTSIPGHDAPSPIWPTARPSGRRPIPAAHGPCRALGSSRYQDTTLSNRHVWGCVCLTWPLADHDAGQRSVRDPLHRCAPRSGGSPAVACLEFPSALMGSRRSLSSGRPKAGPGAGTSGREQAGRFDPMASRFRVSSEVSGADRRP
jgi:hypothetical protein